MKLDLGGVGKRQGKDEWWTVNLGAGIEADYNADIRGIESIVPDWSCEHILCSHTFEHIPCYQHEETLRLWYKKMKTGGLLEIIVPDAEEIIRRYCTGEVTYTTVQNILYGSPERLKNNPLQQHAWGFSFDSLKALVESCGFARVTRKIRNWPYDFENEVDVPYYKKLLINDIHIVCMKG